MVVSSSDNINEGVVQSSLERVDTIARATPETGESVLHAVSCGEGPEIAPDLIGVGLG